MRLEAMLLQKPNCFIIKLNLELFIHTTNKVFLQIKDTLFKKN